MKFMLPKFKLLILLCLLSGSSLFAQQIIDLETALDIAMQNSPDIQTTRISLEQAQENLNAQEASLKTQFGLTVSPFSYSNSREFSDITSEWYTNKSLSSSGTFSLSQPILWTDGTISLQNTFGWQYRENETSSGINENRAYTNELRLSLSQPLFTYNSTKLTLKTLELQLENTNLQYAMQKLNLESQVTQYFYNVYMAQMSLTVAEDELANTQENYDLIVNKVEAGLLAKEELYQAELDYAESESSVQDAQVNLENYKDQFKQYIGMDIYEEITVIADPQVNEVDVDLDKAIEYGLSARMELRQKEIDIENAESDLIKTQDGSDSFGGTVNLSLGYTGDSETIGGMYDNPTKSPSVSMTFNVPIWDWGARKSKIRAAELSLETAELNLEQEKISIIVELRSTYRSVVNQVKQIEIAEKTKENAQLTYDLNQERYANGDLTGMDLKQYQTQLTTANNSYTKALINYKMELLSLKVQSLYDFENNEPVVLDLITE